MVVGRVCRAGSETCLCDCVGGSCGFGVGRVHDGLDLRYFSWLFCKDICHKMFNAVFCRALVDQAAGL